MRVVALLLLSAAADNSLRRELKPTFIADEAFQSHGGTQYFYALDRTVWPEFISLGAATPQTKKPYVVMSRAVHTLSKDVSFFSSERTFDLKYQQAVAPEYEVSQVGPGKFRAERMPANNFTLEHVEREALSARHFEALEKLCGRGPDSVLIQKNSEFERVVGIRTAEASFIWEAHYALAPGQTRVCSVALSYLINLPPFFMGGEGRVHTETLREALGRIRKLRAY